MPRYTYQCSNCEIVFETVHSMKECLTDCTRCEKQEALTRIPAITFIKSNGPSAPSGQKVGALVEQHIREAKEELSKEKTELRTTDYKEQK
jgi:putative FmdB family regulatory protein